MKHNTKNTDSKSIVRVKIWVEHDGNMIMSDYLADLLVKIDETNSIKKAAELLDLPYRTALKKIQEIENSANTEIVSTRSGGATGGKSKLTESGRELINKFNQISNKVMESDGEIFEPKSE